MNKTSQEHGTIFTATQPCPLCQAENCKQIDHSSRAPKPRSFYLCRHCSLVFVCQSEHLDGASEKAIYDFHENNPEDEGYRRFLDKLATPLCSRLTIDAEGLDFGCGPGPTLSKMLRERGFSVAEYDPFFDDNQETLARQYDFVTATEVVEHFCSPHKTFEQLFGLVKPKGHVGLMTKIVPSTQNIANWHYTRDLTHVSFYQRATLDYLAERFDCSLETIGNDVILFQKRH